MKNQKETLSEGVVNQSSETKPLNETILELLDEFKETNQKIGFYGGIEMVSDILNEILYEEDEDMISKLECIQEVQQKMIVGFVEYLHTNQNPKTTNNN